MSDTVQTVLAVLVISIALLAGVTIADGLAGATGEPNEVERTYDRHVGLNSPGSWTRIAYDDGFNETVVNSLGHAVNLTGANDSYIQSRDEVNFGDDTWTVTAWGYVDNDAASDTRTLVSVDGRVIIDYNGSQGVWTAWYYDDGSRNSYRVNVSAPNQPTNFSMVTVRANDTHLTIFRNTTQGETEALSGSSIAQANVNATNWDGRLEELRTFDDPLSDSEISSLHSQPVHPQPGTNRTARAMFDQPDRATQHLYFTGTGLLTSNVTYSAGHPGSEMQGVSLWNELTGESDYRWDSDGPRIMAVDGGELDGAPVAFVSFDSRAMLPDMVQGFANFIEFAALVPLILIVVVVIARVKSM